MNQSTSRIYDGDGATSTLFDKAFGSVLQCHLISIVGVAIICTMIGWVWMKQEFFSFDERHSAEELHRVNQLLDQSEHWQQQLRVQQETKLEIATKLRAIHEWLPRSIDWMSSSKDLRAAAEDHSLKIVLLEHDSDESTARVMKANVNCVVQGEFQDICRFLHSLSEREHPVWCASLHLVQVSEEGGPLQVDVDGTQDQVADVAKTAEEADKPKWVTASMNLCLPFAGGTSAAAKLFASEESHAS